MRTRRGTITVPRTRPVSGPRRARKYSFMPPPLGLRGANGPARGGRDACAGAPVTHFIGVVLRQCQPQGVGTSGCCPVEHVTLPARRSPATRRGGYSPWRSVGRMKTLFSYIRLLAGCLLFVGGLAVQVDPNQT